MYLDSKNANKEKIHDYLHRLNPLQILKTTVEIEHSQKNNTKSIQIDVDTTKNMKKNTISNTKKITRYS